MRLRLKFNITQRKKASTLIALASTEIEAAENLIQDRLYRESAVHLYFASFYLSQSVLVHRLRPNPKHSAVDSMLHQVFGRDKSFPRRYVELHSRLHKFRTDVDYRSFHSPEPSGLKKELRVLAAYFSFVRRSFSEIDYDDILHGILESNPKQIADFSIDIYCPQTYRHHTRFTVWIPPFYLTIFNTKRLASHVKGLLKKLRVKKSSLYVAGLNSKVDQYEDRHLLMFDIDSVDAEVEATLGKIGGVLMKSGRGFHFVGTKVIEGQKAWHRELRRALRDPVLRTRIDRKHVAISLMRGYSTLGITASDVKPAIPHFYKEF
jgi:uncharacterized protein (UPF0332 family)